MQYKEYGAAHPETILLLHGGGLSWWSCREAAQLLEAHYHVIVPILDGHGGSDREFTSIEDQAAEILSFLDSQFSGSAALIAGLSLGGQILLEMLAQRPEVCRIAVVESAPILPDRLTHALVRPAFGSSYGLIRQRWFSRLQFRSLGLRPELFGEYYRDTCRISRQSLIAFMEANTMYTLKDSARHTSAAVHIYAGSREVRSVLRSAALLQDTLPGSTLHLLPGYRHGDLSINHPERFARELLAITGKES